MSERDHERWREELPAYLLGALGPGEAAELERHVEGCDECRAELRWLTPAVGVLPDSVERVRPSQQLRDRVMAEVRADAREARRGRESRRGRTARRGLSIGGLGLRPAAGLAAVLLVAVAIAVYAIAAGGSGEGPGMTTVAAGHAPSVTAKVVSEGDDVATLHLANVHQLPGNEVLEAWVRRRGRIVPVRALFVPDREGRASTRLPDMHGVDAVTVTAEPRGGSDAPTSAPMVTVPMPQ